MQAQGEIESLITSIRLQEKKRRLFAWGIKGILFISISAPCAALSKWYPSWTTMLSAPALIATGFYLWRSKYESLTVSRLQAAQILDEMLHVKERVSAFAAISESSEASDTARCALISEQIQAHLCATPIHPRLRPELTPNQRKTFALSIASLTLALALYLFRPISPFEKLAQAVEAVLEAHPELPQEVAIMAQQSVEDLRSSDLLAAQESLAQTRDAVAQALADLKNGDSADERTVESDSFNADAPARPSKEIAAISSPTPTPAGIEGEQSEKEQQGSGGDKKDENQGDKQSDNRGEDQGDKQSQRGQGQSKQSGSNGAGDKRTEGSSGSGKQQEQDSDGGDGDGDGSGKGASKQQGDKSQSGDGSGGSGGQNGGHDQQKDRRGERSKEGQSKDGQNGESGDGSNPNSSALEKLKDAVDQASQQLNQQKDQGAQQSQKGEQQQEGKQAGQGQQSDQGSQNQQGAKGSQGQQGKESDKSQGAGQSENNAEGSSSSNGEQNNNRSDRNENGKEEGKEKGKEKGKQGSKEANNKAKDPGSSGQGSSSQKEQNKERKPQQEDGDIDSTGDRSSMPDRSAQPTDQDPSSGTGSGGTETANSPAKEAKIEGSDERFDARFTGASGELEKSKKDAQAKTTLKDIILAKPKGSTHKGDQPIPLEYRGILGD